MGNKITIGFTAIFGLIFSLHNSITTLAQLPCIPASGSSFSFSPTPASQNSFINWAAFPSFSLPFKIIYSGPHFDPNSNTVLSRGFSHLSSNAFASLPASQRAFLYYGVAYNFFNPQPWQLIRSPWGNDLAGYQNKWKGEMTDYAKLFDDTRQSQIPTADILALDIERHWEGQFDAASNLAILAEKNNALVPDRYKQLTDNEYLRRYKLDMLQLYSKPLNESIFQQFTHIGSYADVPIRYQEANIEANSWTDWQQNTNRLSYLMRDSTSGQLGGPFYKQLSLMMPSIYVQNEYSALPKAKGGDYLAQMLFQIEVNKAWSAKEIIPFVWLRYENQSLAGDRYVKSYQAEAMAIFPFFSGAKGLWLWEDPAEINRQQNWTMYEHFIHGLYKLSNYKSFFSGSHELYMAQPARDLYAEQLPVWRAVVKDNKILIAAQNPYAAENETTKLDVNYKEWRNTISLKGREVFLCAFDLFKVTDAEKNNYSGLKILENPINNHQLTIENQGAPSLYEVTIHDKQGRKIFSQSRHFEKGITNILLPRISKGIYLLSAQNNRQKIYKKILIND